MRLALVVALGFALLAPGVSAAGPAECAQLDRQIAHYSKMAERAQKLDSEMWEAGMSQQVEVLKQRQNALLCPGSDAVAARQSAKYAAEVLKMAGRAALQFFTFGAF